jgi:fumarate hydratase, class II
VENFPISDLRFPAGFIAAIGLIKGRRRRPTWSWGCWTRRSGGPSPDAAGEVVAGDHDAQFVVDIFQTGSGTSTNMNANEVIATLASRRLGDRVHPNDHVNSGQSSNDVIPTAMQVAAAVAMERALVPALERLQGPWSGRRRSSTGS